jgi:hypothetical protein
MSKAKFVLLSLLAAFAVSAIASATASAAHVFKIEGTEITKNEEVEGVSQEGLMETEAASTTFGIVCKEDYSALSAKNVIEKGGKSKGELEFKSCLVYIVEKTGAKSYNTGCSVTEPVKAEFTDELTNAGEDTFTGAGAEELFSEVKIKGTCAFGGTALKVKGKELCEIPEYLAEQVLHHLVCTPAGSSLKSGASSARLFNEEIVKIKSAKPWSSN